MTQTPLLDALRSYSDSHPLRMHMPGHHGVDLPLLPELKGYAGLDVTELAPTGNLFSPGGPIEEAERLWAQAFSMSACLFLTGGSTQGLHAALALSSRPGDGILLDRGCHRAVYYALALLDLQPRYLLRPWLVQAGITGPLSPHDVEKAMDEDTNLKTVCITSPTYYGILSDIPAIGAVVHARGGTLVVDGAHGAHLPFLGPNPFNGADLVVVSAHKTLPAPGQTALLFSGGAYGEEQLRWAASIYGSSSPSYPMMAALDVLRAWMCKEGREAYRATEGQVAALRREYPLPVEGAILDPCRLVLPCGDGFAVQTQLEELGVWPEMADSGHVVFLPTCADGPVEFVRLRQALSQVSFGEQRRVPPPPHPPETVCSPRKALFAPRKEVVLEQAEGMVSAVQVAPYPPGIPVIVPGERVEKKQLSYLREIEYNSLNRIGVL